MDDYQQSIRILSDRIVLAQTPIRVLDAVKWDDTIRKGFLKAKGKEMPAVDRDYYLNRPLSFDSSKVKLEFQNIERDITRQLGQFNPVGQIMRRMCKEYRMVVRMLEARGTEDFGLISQELYGAASDAFHAGDPTLSDLGLMLSDYLNNIDGRGDLKDEPKTPHRQGCRGFIANPAEQGIWRGRGHHSGVRVRRYRGRCGGRRRLHQDPHRCDVQRA